MAKKGHTDEQILRALRQAEGGTHCGRITANTRHQRRHLLHLEEEVRGARLERVARAPSAARGKPKLKHLVADLSLDRHILQEIVQKKL